MEQQQYNIADLAAAAGVTARAVRFYVQQGLLPAPTGVGRGDHYTDAHYRRLLQIQQLQRAGYSLAAIRTIAAAVEAEAAPLPPVVAGKAPTGSAGRQGEVSATLVSRVTLLPGVTVEFDATRFQPDAQGLAALRELAWQVFAAP